MKIEAIVWDIGGVLIEDPSVNNFWKENPDSKELRELFGTGKISINLFISKGAKMLNMSKEKFLKKYKEVYLSVLIIKEVFDIYQRIQINKYILSDTNPIHAKYIQANFKQILKLAKGVFLSNQIKRRKSDLETFEFLIKEIGLKSEHILFIDNTKEHIERAKSLGINIIHYQTPKQLLEELKRYGIKI